MAALALTLLGAAGEQPAAASVVRSGQSPALEALWIDMRIGPPLVPLFNDVARGDDIARVDHYSQIGQLAGISEGQKLVIFRSTTEAEQVVPELAGDIDMLGYNLEHGPGTPPGEQADPVASIEAMRALADAHGLGLAFGPDHDFALSHGVSIAPYVDIFVLQVQRQQTNPEIVKGFVEPLVPQLRAANPQLEISVQVRTEGDAQDIVALIESIDVALDGVSILTSPETVDVAHDLVYALRPPVTEPPPGPDQNLVLIPLAVAQDTQ